jgi:hypothetical protein
MFASAGRLAVLRRRYCGSKMRGCFFEVEKRTSPVWVRMMEKVKGDFVYLN